MHTPTHREEIAERRKQILLFLYSRKEEGATTLELNSIIRNSSGVTRGTLRNLISEDLVSAKTFYGLGFALGRHYKQKYKGWFITESGEKYVNEILCKKPKASRKRKSAA